MKRKHFLLTQNSICVLKMFLHKNPDFIYNIFMTKIKNVITWIILEKYLIIYYSI